jgi:hypothetical protein
MEFSSPSADELEAISRVKSQLLAEYPDSSKFSDTTYLRFLRGRKHEEDKALRAMIRYIEWRQDNGVDSIKERTNEFKDELESGKLSTSYFDKDGRPVAHIFARKHNKNTRDLDQIRKLIIFALEDILQRAKPEEERMVICFDLKGFSLNCMDYDAVKVLIEILGFNYPETLHRAVIVNAPFLFSACWVIIKPWLDPVTASKVSFIRIDQLKEHFSEDNIPADLM